jgi:hypothetical protein
LLESIGFQVALADLYARPGLLMPLGSKARWRHVDCGPIPGIPTAHDLIRRSPALPPCSAELILCSVV